MNPLIADHVLKDLFALGTTTSEAMEVYPGVKVKFRLLTMDETIEVSEATTRYTGLESRSLVSQVQTLARAIVEINGMALFLAPAEADKLSKEWGRDVSRVEQAAYILVNDVPQFVLNELNQAYLKFYQDVLNKVEEIKKKLKKPL